MCPISHRRLVTVVKWWLLIAFRAQLAPAWSVLLRPRPLFRLVLLTLKFPRELDSELDRELILYYLKILFWSASRYAMTSSSCSPFIPLNRKLESKFSRMTRSCSTIALPMRTNSEDGTPKF